VICTQTLATLDTVTGEVVNITLRHEGNDVRGWGRGDQGVQTGPIHDGTD